MTEPYTMAITTIYSAGIVKGWRVLKASTTDEYASVAIEFDVFKEYYNEYPIRGKIYDPIPGTDKIIEYLIVVDMGDLKV